MATINSYLHFYNPPFPILDSTGKITGYKTAVGGADTVFPFNEKSQIQFASLGYGQSKTISFQNVSHGYMAYVYGCRRANGQHILSVSNNVSLTSLVYQTVTEVNILGAVIQFFEFTVKDYNEAVFSITAGTVYDTAAVAYILIACDK